MSNPWAWVMIFLAGLMEPLWVLALVKSEGGSKPYPVLLAIILIILSFSFFTMALNKLGPATAYGVWIAIGTTLIFLSGWWLGHEQISIWKAISICLIVLGVIGLKSF